MRRSTGDAELELFWLRTHSFRDAENEPNVGQPAHVRGRHRPKIEPGPDVRRGKPARFVQTAGKEEIWAANLVIIATRAPGCDDYQEREEITRVIKGVPPLREDVGAGKERDGGGESVGSAVF